MRHRTPVQWPAGFKNLIRIQDLFASGANRFGSQHGECVGEEHTPIDEIDSQLACGERQTHNPRDMHEFFE
jgi:hypothetical protein